MLSGTLTAHNFRLELSDVHHLNAMLRLLDPCSVLRLTYALDPGVRPPVQATRAANAQVRIQRFI